MDDNPQTMNKSAPLSCSCQEFHHRNPKRLIQIHHRLPEVMVLGLCCCLCPGERPCHEHATMAEDLDSEVSFSACGNPRPPLPTPSKHGAECQEDCSVTRLGTPAGAQLGRKQEATPPPQSSPSSMPSAHNSFRCVCGWVCVRARARVYVHVCVHAEVCGGQERTLSPSESRVEGSYELFDMTETRTAGTLNH